MQFKPTFYKWLTLLLVTGTAVITFSLVLFVSQGFAQGNDEIQVDKRLGRPNPIIHVGEYITFTIRIWNRTSFTVTTLPLSDTFNTAVLQYVDAAPPPDNIDEANGRLDWNDLTTSVGDLGVGQGITVVVGFVAEHPEPAVVNAAEVHDALGDEGALPGGNDTSDNTESVGGSAPVDKKLLGGLVPEVGLPLTFTITITNNGFTTMTVVPLVEDYEPQFLQFVSADPQPDVVDEVTGELSWSDLTLWLGDIPAHESITLTVVFIALAPIDVTTNSASVSDAEDWYDNDVAGGADLVPITIIEAGGATPTSMPTATTTSVPATATPVTAPTESAPEATPVPQTTTPVAARAPNEIPATGIPPRGLDAVTLFAMALAAVLPVAGWWIWQRTRR